MKLNGWMIHIISHRPIDCIIEAAIDSWDGDASEADDMSDFLNSIDGWVDKWVTDRYIDVANLNEFQQFILGDIIDGSTYAARLVQNRRTRTAFDGHQEEYNNICRAGKRLAEEYNKYFSPKIEFPVP